MHQAVLERSPSNEIADLKSSSRALDLRQQEKIEIGQYRATGSGSWGYTQARIYAPFCRRRDLRAT
jgi:hypothetical protein